MSTKICPIKGTKNVIKSHIFPSSLLRIIEKQVLGYVKKNLSGKEVKESRIFKDNKQPLFSEEVDNLMGDYENRFTSLYNQITNGHTLDNSMEVQAIIGFFAETMLVKAIFCKKPVSFSHHFRPFSEEKLAEIGMKLYYNLEANKTHWNDINQTKYLYNGTYIYIHDPKNIIATIENLSLDEKVLKIAGYFPLVAFLPLKKDKIQLNLFILKLPCVSIVIPVDEIANQILLAEPEVFTVEWLYSVIYNFLSKQNYEQEPLIASNEIKFAQQTNQLILDSKFKILGWP